MRHHRTIASTFALFASTVFVPFAPSAAVAAGPLLSGYGPPGAGAQKILGASLLNGPGGGSGGGSAGAGASASGAATAGSALSNGAVATGTDGSSATNGSATTRRAHGGRASRGASTAGGTPTRTHSRAAGANPNQAHLGTAAAVSTGDSSTSWFSGSDLLALALASGALALIALATARLARAGHD